MADKSEQFRNIPAIRGLLADPRRTSREMEELYAQLTKQPDTTQLPQAIDQLRIPNSQFSDVVSNAILNNQREYEDMGINIENLSDTLGDVGSDIQLGMYEMIDEQRKAVEEMRRKNNITRKGVGRVNTNLESIDDKIGESNELSKITNHVLLGIMEQRASTGGQIVDVLQDIGGVITNNGFNQIGDALYEIQEVNMAILQTNQEILQELYKQSETPYSIDQRLANPLDIQADNYCRNGMEMMNIDKPSKSDWKVALESFENGLKAKPAHLFNLYGAGTASKNIGEDKKATTYLHRGYKLATKATNSALSKNIAMDLAKIYTKYLKLKLAKRRLDQAIFHDKENIEAYLLKARITNILQQKEEFKGLLTIIYQKIIEGKQIHVTSNYQDVLKYLYKPVQDMVDQHIQKGLLIKLLTILPTLQQIGDQNSVKTILEHVLFVYPREVKKSQIDVKSILTTHKDFFTEKYKEFANKKIIGAVSEDYFILAYLGYKIIDQDLINKIVHIGLEFDEDCIRLRNSPTKDKGMTYKKNVIEKIYMLGDNAKYMLRDYIKAHPKSILI